MCARVCVEEWEADVYVFNASSVICLFFHVQFRLGEAVPDNQRRSLNQGDVLLPRCTPTSMSLRRG